MNIPNKITIRKTTLATVLAALLLIMIIGILIVPLGSAPNIVGSNYKNVTVWTYVNITNAKPEVRNVTVYAQNNISNNNITINAGSTKTVYCNATVRDWNGFNDIVYVNATLWHNFVQINDSDNNNTHYTNSSCTLNGSIDSTTGWYVCSFDVLYYSNNGTWNCNVSISDTYNKTGTGMNRTLFYPVYSLNVTDGLDYGNLAVEEFSENLTANITNLGNMAINVSVEGYGVRRGDGLAMNCSISGNITVANQRYSLTDVDYASKTSLTGNIGGSLIPNLTMPKQTLADTYVVNITYWQLYIPPNPAGNCSGFVLFTALAP